MVIHRKGDWDWADWGQNADVAILDSVWFYLALKGAVEMARLIGHDADISGYESQMHSIEAGFNPTFWKGEFYQSPTHKGDTDDRANAMAVVAHLAKPEQYAALRRLLAVKTHASPYMEKYVLEALFLMGAPEQGIERMKTRYAGMIAEPISTLWENFGGTKGHGGSGTYNHAWSGGPLTMMSQYMAGVAPTSPGWKTFAVRPQLGSLSSIDAIVPTMYGNITLMIKRTDKSVKLDLNVPTGTSAEVNVPKPATGEWSTLRVNGKKAEHRKNDGTLELTSGAYVIEGE